MTDSYLLFTLSNYAAKLVDKETSPKYYFMDTGLLGLMLLDCKSAQLENLVAIELIRRYGIENVFFFENNVKIDFYVPSEKLAIQVSMQVLDNIDTKERETRTFVSILSRTSTNVGPLETCDCDKTSFNSVISDSVLFELIISFYIHVRFHGSLSLHTFHQYFVNFIPVKFTGITFDNVASISHLS